ncbi:hypothetical protein D3C87_78960 [compost metagenome]
MTFFGEDIKKLGAHYNTLRVLPQFSPNMTVKVTAGSFWYNYKTFVDFPGATTSTIVAPTTQGTAKIVIVAINKAALLSIIDGVASTNPKIPELLSSVMPLAFVLVKYGQTFITDESIFDARAIFHNPSFVVPHNLIEGRDVNNAHPINSITNLRSELDEKVSISLLDSHLNTKSDVNGTPAKSFTINKNSVGVPLDDVFINVERGSLTDATIQWDETNDRWVFNEDLAIKDNSTGRLTGVLLQDYLGESENIYRLIVKQTGEIGVINVNDELNPIFMQSNGDGKVKLDSADSADYLESKLDTNTLEKVSGKIKVKTVFSSDLEISDLNKGVILKSPDGSRFRLSVENDGTITSSKLS